MTTKVKMENENEKKIEVEKGVISKRWKEQFHSGTSSMEREAAAAAAAVVWGGMKEKMPFPSSSS